MNIKMMVLAGILGISSHAQAFYQDDVSKFLRICESTSITEIGVCTGFLQGVHDTNQALQQLGYLAEDIFCIPQYVREGQLIRVFVNYANRNPEKRQIAASSLVIYAYIDEFPCR